MAFQELEWHAVDDVDFDDREADILENVHESETPCLGWYKTSLDKRLTIMTCFAF